MGGRGRWWRKGRSQGEISSMKQNQEGVNDTRHLLCFHKSFKGVSSSPSLPQPQTEMLKLQRGGGQGDIKPVTMSPPLSRMAVARL